MKREINVFFTALMFYTRIPCPPWVGHDAQMLNAATRYFPLIGWIVGFISAVVLVGGSYLFGTFLGVLFSMIASILTTGAFHEDGFADVCDGFGGGWTKEKILEIMKDSRLGTYGVTGLVLLLAVKFFSLQHLAESLRDQSCLIMLILITGHALSRFTASTFIFTHPYVRDAPNSKVKPVAQSTGKSNLIIAAFFAAVPLAGLIFLSGKPLVLALVAPVYLSKVYLSRYFTKWIGGYTGDCLGATQQVSEIVFYLSCILLWKFI